MPFERRRMRELSSAYIISAARRASIPPSLHAPGAFGHEDCLFLPLLRLPLPRRRGQEDNDRFSLSAGSAVNALGQPPHFHPRHLLPCLMMNTPKHDDYFSRPSYMMRHISLFSPTAAACSRAGRDYSWTIFRRFRGWLGITPPLPRDMMPPSRASRVPYILRRALPFDLIIHYAIWRCRFRLSRHFVVMLFFISVGNRAPQQLPDIGMD